MAWVYASLVQETTASTGSPFTLGGSPAGRWDFASRMSESDQTVVIVQDNDTNPVFEKFTATLTGGQIVKGTLLESSTGTDIVWPGTGTRDIYIVPDAQIMAALFDGNLGTGLIAKTAVGTAAVRTPTFTAAAAAPTDDLWTESDWDGVAGPPDLQLNFDPLARSSGATETQRTMVGELVQSAATTKLTTLAGDATSVDVTDSTDVSLFQFYKTDVNDALFKVLVGGSFENVLTSSASAGFFADVQVATSVSDVLATVATETIVSITPPATGTYHIIVLGIVHGDASGIGDATVAAQIQMDTLASGYGVVATSQQVINASTNAEINVWAFYSLPSPVNSQTYNFQVLPATTNATMDGDAGAGQVQTCAAFLFRTG